MIRFDEDIRSLSEFKRNTAEMISRVRKSKRPMVLTVNGRAALVVHDPAAYQKWLDQKDWDETVAGINEGLAAWEAGDVVSLDEAARIIRNGSKASR